MEPNQNINNQNTQVGQSPSLIPSSHQQSPKKRSGKLSTIFLALLGIIVVGLVVAVLMQQKKNATDTTHTTSQIKSLGIRVAALEAQDNFAKQQVDKSLYQAVFLTNGQTYFGKITDITKDTIKIEDIYYLKTGSIDKSGNPTPGASLSLTKLGSEVHGPKDTMIIERKNVLFWENLKSDGKVSEAIAVYKKQNPTN